MVRPVYTLIGFGILIAMTTVLGLWCILDKLIRSAKANKKINSMTGKHNLNIPVKESIEIIYMVLAYIYVVCPAIRIVIIPIVESLK